MAALPPSEKSPESDSEAPMTTGFDDEPPLVGADVPPVEDDELEEFDDEPPHAARPSAKATPSPSAAGRNRIGQPPCKRLQKVYSRGDEATMRRVSAPRARRRRGEVRLACADDRDDRHRGDTVRP